MGFDTTSSLNIVNQAPQNAIFLPTFKKNEVSPKKGTFHIQIPELPAGTKIYYLPPEAGPKDSGLQIFVVPPKNISQQQEAQLARSLKEVKVQKATDPAASKADGFFSRLFSKKNTEEISPSKLQEPPAKRRKSIEHTVREVPVASSSRNAPAASVGNLEVRPMPQDGDCLFHSIVAGFEAKHPEKAKNYFPEGATQEEKARLLRNLAAGELKRLVETRSEREAGPTPENEVSLSPAEKLKLNSCELWIEKANLKEEVAHLREAMKAPTLSPKKLERLGEELRNKNLRLNEIEGELRSIKISQRNSSDAAEEDRPFETDRQEEESPLQQARREYREATLEAGGLLEEQARYQQKQQEWRTYAGANAPNRDPTSEYMQKANENAATLKKLSELEEPINVWRSQQADKKQELEHLERSANKTLDEDQFGLLQNLIRNAMTEELEAKQNQLEETLRLEIIDGADAEVKPSTPGGFTKLEHRDEKALLSTVNELAEVREKITSLNDDPPTLEEILEFIEHSRQDGIYCGPPQVYALSHLLGLPITILQEQKNGNVTEAVRRPGEGEPVELLRSVDIAHYDYVERRR